MSLRQSQAWWIIWAWISGSFSLYSHEHAGTRWNGWSSACLDVHLGRPALRMPLRPRWVPKTIPIWAECQVRRSQDAKVLGKLLKCINDASMANGCQWLFVFRGVPYWFFFLYLHVDWALKTSFWNVLDLSWHQPTGFWLKAGCDAHTKAIQLWVHLKADWTVLDFAWVNDKTRITQYTFKAICVDFLDSSRVLWGSNRGSSYFIVVEKPCGLPLSSTKRPRRWRGHGPWRHQWTALTQASSKESAYLGVLELEKLEHRFSELQDSVASIFPIEPASNNRLLLNAIEIYWNILYWNVVERFELITHTLCTL